jgi:hypothetical protein
MSKRLAAVAAVFLVVVTLTAVGLYIGWVTMDGPAESTSQAPRTSTVELQWREARSALGKYVALFPAEPTTRTEPADNGMTASFTMSDSQNITFSLLEAPLNGNAPKPLDEVVDIVVEGMRVALGPPSGTTVTATPLSRTTGDFEGVETREFSYELIRGNTRAIATSMVFYRDDVLVQALVMSNNETEAPTVARFLTSLRPNVG